MLVLTVSPSSESKKGIVTSSPTFLYNWGNRYHLCCNDNSPPTAPARLGDALRFASILHTTRRAGLPRLLGASGVRLCPGTLHRPLPSVGTYIASTSVYGLVRFGRDPHGDRISERENARGQKFDDPAEITD